LKIPYVNLSAQWSEERENLLPIIDKALSKGDFVGGEAITEFEKRISKLCKVDYVVALNSGTDALTLALHLLGVGKGDEVITTPNSFISSAAVIIHLGAKPVFVDVLEDQNMDPSKLTSVITSRTKAIMPVHLTGRMCEMDEIMQIADQNSVPVVEDAAQSIGSRYKDRPSGSIGRIGCFSAHPLKNLNAFGDAGFLTTDSKEMAEKARSLSNHGLRDRNIVERFGFVSRMDTLQAVILNYHLENLNKVINTRRENALKYSKILNPDYVSLNESKKDFFETYHTFVIKVNKRDSLKHFLESKGVETSIHYPIPIHLQPAASYLNLGVGSFPVVEDQANRILTLPVNQYVSTEEINIIAQQINSFFVENSYG
tara:strand:- start:115 stop:1227 length:1113 start_codon:yes stop_codon:yes gene_type:complete